MIGLERDVIETGERSGSKGQKKPILSLHQVRSTKKMEEEPALFSHEYNHPLVSLIYKQQPKKKAITTAERNCLYTHFL